MPRKPPCETKKLRGPLYGAAWVGKYCIVAGAGGGSFGIPNSVSCIEHNGTSIGEVVTALDMGSDAPLRMAVTADSKTLILAVATGGLVLVNLDITADNADLRSLGTVKSIDLSRSNRWLATGTEDGYVTVFAWPSLRKATSFRCGDKPRDCVRDISFSSSHNDKVLATVHEDGSCRLWEVTTGTLLDTVTLPADLERTSTFGRAVFLEEGVFRPPTLVTAVKAGKQGRILTWEQDANGELRLKSNVKTRTSPITAMSVSRDGAIVGCTSSDGDLALLSTESGRCLRKAMGAHMVFGTATTFSNDSKGFLSVSGDASLCTLPTTPASSGVQSLPIVLVILCILAVLVAVAFSKFKEMLLL